MPRHVALTTPARSGWTALSVLAFASLPGWARRLYRTPGLPTTDLAATVGLRTLAPLLQRLPATYRESPQLRAARARLAAAPPRQLRLVDG
jgi:hypothetical protein